MDLRGSVLSTFTSTTAVPARQDDTEYDAWGARYESISSYSPPRHGFTAKEPDPFTELYHYGPRTYDPSLHRWLSPDPLIGLYPARQAGIGEQLNLYAYASNNPATRLDLSGLEDNGGILNAIRNSPNAHMVAGLLYGSMKAITPAGFINPVSPARSREFLTGEAAGQGITGGVMIVAEGSAAGGGAIGAVPTGGGSLAITAVGVGVAGAGMANVALASRKYGEALEARRVDQGNTTMKPTQQVGKRSPWRRRPAGARRLGARGGPEQGRSLRQASRTLRRNKLAASVYSVKRRRRAHRAVLSGTRTTPFQSHEAEIIPWKMHRTRAATAT